MCPLHNGLDEDDYGLLTFRLDGDGDGPDDEPDPKSETEDDVPGDELSGEPDTTPGETEGNGDTAGTAGAPDETEQEPLPPPEAVENAVGFSSSERRFDFRAQAIFTRHGFGRRVLNALQFIFPVLAIASLFLHLTGVPRTIVWIIFVSCLVLGALSALLLRLLRKPWKSPVDFASLTFRADTLEIELPASFAEDFGFSEPYPAAAAAREDTYWVEDDKLRLILTLDELIDQAYHTADRTTLITFDVSFADRLLTLRIPDAALDRESRSELETEVFNRAGRSLRAIKD